MLQRPLVKLFLLGTIFTLLLVFCFHFNFNQAFAGEQETSNQLSLKQKEGQSAGNQETTAFLRANASTTSRSTRPQGGSITSQRYTVQKGDSLFLIARQYGTKVQELKKVNNLKSDLIYPGQVFLLPSRSGKNNKPLAVIIREKGITSHRGLSVLIVKSVHSFSILNEGTWLKTYHAEFGEQEPGDKEIAGDRKTPEGTFYITQKSVLIPEDEYLGTRWLRLSYPTIEDAKRGLDNKTIDRWTYNQIVEANKQGTTPPQYTKLGGGIGIHGGDKPAFGFNWTWGCVGLSNKDVEEFYDFLDIGTQVVIKK